MKSLHRYLLLGGLAASLGIGAIAQTQTTPPANPAPQQVEQHRDRMQQKVERKLGQLKQKMQITAAQEGAWNAWAGSVKPGARQRPSRAEFAALSTPERIDRMRAARAQRDAEMDRRFDATRSFYASLTPEQKKVFDAESLRFARHHHGKEGMFRRG